MDLVQTIRKQGSRGGRDEFKWDDVKTSAHRENYLGHSLMAPVGRWQKNKDLSWYAKTDGKDEEKSEADLRKEEIKRIKEAEERAMAKALGYEVPSSKEDNANLTTLGGSRDLQKTIEQSAGENGDEGTGRGLGYGKYDAGKKYAGEEEVLEGERDGMGGLDRERAPDSRGKRDEGGRRRERTTRRERHRSRSPHEHTRRDDKRSDDSHRHRRRRHDSHSRSRSPSRERRRSRSRDRGHDRDQHHSYRDRHDDRNYRHRNPNRRSRSPYRHPDSHHRRRSNRADNY